jgi:hypothetical protein
MRGMTGGNKRTFEIMKRSKSHGIEYVSIIDTSSILHYKLSGEELPNFRYSISFARSLSCPKYFYPLKTVKFCEQIALVARSEKVDLIYSPHKLFHLEWIARLSSSFASLPWTVLLQLIPVLRDPRPPASLEELMRFRVYLSLARNTKLLSVSSVISKFLLKFESGAKILTIEPGNGVDLQRIRSLPSSDESFDAIYFARLIRKRVQMTCCRYGVML